MSWMTQRPESAVKRSRPGKRQLVLERVAGSSLASGAAEFEQLVKVPSARLSVLLSLFWSRVTCVNSTQVAEIRNNGLGSFLDDATNLALLGAREVPYNIASGNALEISADSGLMHTIYSGSVPFAYELSTQIPLIRVAWTVTSPEVPAASGNRVTVEWALRARFEPNVPIDDDELDVLFKDCDISGR